MKTETAKTNYYEIEVDTDKNRVYIKFMGNWNNMSKLATFFDDWKKTAIHIKPNFTIFADVRLMMNLSREAEKLHQEIQKYLVDELKLLATAQLASFDSLADYQIHRSTQRSNLVINKFATQQEAEQYLDKMSEENNSK